MCAKENSLQVKYPKIAAQWNHEKNLRVKPNMVKSVSGKIFWWKCEKWHEWRASIANRTKQGSNCPFCSGQRVCVDNCLQKLNPKLAEQWHPDKNGNLKPNNVTIGSNKKVWWRCENGHDWKTSVNNRTNGNNCPFCSGQRVCTDNSLQTLNLELSKQWHIIKNSKTPNDYTNNSGIKVWWQCEEGHEWEARIADRTKIDGTGCPFCAGQRVCLDNCLQTLKPKLANEWHHTKNNDLTPNDVTTGSGKKVWWLCDKCGHEYKATVKNRFNGSSCPHCSNHLQKN